MTARDVVLAVVLALIMALEWAEPEGGAREATEAGVVEAVQPYTGSQAGPDGEE